jgi:hypothetical protein
MIAADTESHQLVKRHAVVGIRSESSAFAVKPLRDREAAQQERHPCKARNQTNVLRPDLWASERPAMSDARMPAGQHKDAALCAAFMRSVCGNKNPAHCIWGCCGVSPLRWVTRRLAGFVQGGGFLPKKLWLNFTVLIRHSRTVGNAGLVIYCCISKKYMVPATRFELVTL